MYLFRHESCQADLVEVTLHTITRLPNHTVHCIIAITKNHARRNSHPSPCATLTIYTIVTVSATLPPLGRHHLYQDHHHHHRIPITVEHHHYKPPLLAKHNHHHRYHRAPITGMTIIPINPPLG